MMTFHTKGFTLVELLLYVSITSLILVTSSAFLGTIVAARIKSSVVSEVEGQGLHVTHLIAQAVRNASVINTPSAGTTSTSLSLGTYAAGQNPTIFSEVGGIIQVTEGTAVPVALTSTQVVASNFSVVNPSNALAPGGAAVSFTLTYANPSGRNEYQYAQTFTVGAARRQP